MHKQLHILENLHDSHRPCLTIRMKVYNTKVGHHFNVGHSRSAIVPETMGLIGDDQYMAPDLQEQEPQHTSAQAALITRHGQPRLPVPLLLVLGHVLGVPVVNVVQQGNPHQSP